MNTYAHEWNARIFYPRASACICGHTVRLRSIRVDSCAFVAKISVRGYSYLSASVGFNRAALFAGRMPNSSPTSSDTVNATMIEIGEIGI
jgi:hypothetical protein